MRILGLSFQFHDAAATVIEDGEILYASHSERYSKIKNDPFLNRKMISQCLKFGKPVYDIFIDDKNINSEQYFK